jgi:hypothetical protein
METNRNKAHNLALGVLKHKLGRAVMPIDFLTYNDILSETTTNILALLDNGLEVTLDQLIDSLQDETSGGAPGPPPQNGI